MSLVGPFLKEQEVFVPHGSFLEIARDYKSQRIQSSSLAVNEQQLAVDCFISRFTLTEEEADLLQSRDIQINSQFFRAMRRAELIIKNTRVLMNGEDGPTKAG